MKNGEEDKRPTESGISGGETAAKNEKAMTDYRKHLEQGKGNYSVRYTRFFNIFAKVAAFLIAFGIWMYATENDTVVGNTTVYSVPVQILNLSSADNQLSLISGYNSTVDVVLEGKKGTIRAVKSEDVTASADITGITTAGKHNVPVTVSVPEGTSVVSQSLSYVLVYLDSTSSVTVPVRVKYSSYMLDDGYELGEAEPGVNQITVSGPENVLSSVDAAQVSLDLGHLTGSVTVTGDLKLVNSAGEEVSNPYLKLQTSSVQVSVPVYISKTLPLTVDFKYGYLSEGNSSVKITPSEIIVKGEASVLDKLTKLSIATIDEKHLQSDTVVQEINTPDGVYKASNDETATIKIEHIGTEVKTVVIDKITVNNPSGLKYELQTQSINVKLRGPSIVMTSITADSVEASVDLSFDKTVSGTSTVPVKLTINNTFGGTVYEIGDYSATVKISQ